tara:strand:- start:107 stop:460 length:354 start_codon:yes stop_codon:yes gene_type:complete
MIDPLEDTHTRRVRDRRPTKAMRGCATRLSSLSLSLSFALKKSQDDEENIDAKKIDIHGDISKYLSNSKRSLRKGEFPRKLSPDIIIIIISRVLIILVLKVAQKNVPSSAPPESSRL